MQMRGADRGAGRGARPSLDEAREAQPDDAAMERLHPLTKQAIAKQVMAAFVRLANKQSVGMTYLMKLVYLADKRSLQKHGVTITCSPMWAMQHGPVSRVAWSVSADGLHGGPDDAFLKCNGTPADQRPVSLTRKIRREDLDCLSDLELEVIKATWAKYQHMSEQELIAFCHEQLPEYKLRCAIDGGHGDDIEALDILTNGKPQEATRKVMDAADIAVSRMSCIPG